MNPIPAIQINNGLSVAAIGNAALLKRTKTGLLCSRKCPADKILEAYDRFKEWASDPNMTVISGFHSPVEKECLRLLLKGKANIIPCPAREIDHMHISKEWKPALDAGRMLILSPFTEKRSDARTIDRRNHLVAALSETLYIPHAAFAGKLSIFQASEGGKELQEDDSEDGDGRRSEI
ncbi:MAG: DNA-binding protein [Lentisphaerae bacterium]|jgi:predicted Rossmann fold nucleotide-binding protein DprA/Smf involved in DNA uptake|nr:DNA-binding protein [Lentisphaerota bacterium]